MGHFWLSFRSLQRIFEYLVNVPSNRLLPCGVDSGQWVVGGWMCIVYGRIALKRVQILLAEMFENIYKQRRQHFAFSRVLSRLLVRCEFGWYHLGNLWEAKNSLNETEILLSFWQEISISIYIKGDRKTKVWFFPP